MIIENYNSNVVFLSANKWEENHRNYIITINVNDFFFGMIRCLLSRRRFFLSLSRFLFFFVFFVFLCFSFMVSSSWKHALHLKEFSSILWWWKRMSQKEKNRHLQTNSKDTKENVLLRKDFHSFSVNKYIQVINY